jgi:two-component system, cell cycle response regulator
MPQHILIIDDSQNIHALLQARLKDEPVVLHFANGGDEGLLKAQNVIPDLILLDVDMPDPNGFEVCRRLKLSELLHGIPVIFLSGASSTEEKIRGLELGAIDYITKPFDPAELRARVRAALRMKFMIDLLAKKAQIDALTGLWNRRYFDQRLDAEISLANRARRSLAVIMLDLDHFKSVNDQYGHPMGDEVLRRVGHLLVESVRTEDIICRYGGEEVAVIIPNASSGAAELAERLRRRIESEKFIFGGIPSKVSASFGVACRTGMIDASIVQAADEALYQAKQGGRNRVAVAPEPAPDLAKPAA